MTFDPRSPWAAMQLAKAAMEPVSLRVRGENVVVAVRGSPPEQDLLSRLERLASEPALQDAPRILCDNRGFERVVSRDFVDATLEVVRDHLAQFQRSRVAFVAGSTAQFGMQRMFCLRSEELLRGAQAFQNIKDAKRWLSAPNV